MNENPTKTFRNTSNIPVPKHTGPIIAPLRPSMNQRLIIARMRREIEKDKHNGQSRLPGGTHLQLDQPEAS